MTLIAIALAAALAAAPRPDCHGMDRVERTAWVMGTLLRIEVTGARTCALAAAEAALDEVERLDSVLSSWRPDAELGRLNRAAPGLPAALSPELRGLLAEAARWRDSTGGAFDPAVGALIDAWDLRGAGRVPGPAELAEALAAGGLPACFDLETGVRRAPRCWLDSGAFGKGAALRAAARVLHAGGVTSAVLDFGGQLEVLGAPVEVSVAHPADRARPVGTLRVGTASVATSSQSERFIEAGGLRYGHVLDPRTGRPVAPWGSVTVVAADALVADILATALFVMGPDAALAWGRAHTAIGVLVLRDVAGDVVASWNAALEPFLSSAPTNPTTPSKETL